MPRNTQCSSKRTVLATAGRDGDAGRVRTPRIAAFACALALVVTGCAPLDGPPAAGAGDPPGVPPGARSTEAGGANAEASLRQLDELAVADWASMSGYSRDRFQHWTGQGEGCDTRDVVLRRDGDGVTTGEDCAIKAGTWFSVYDGKTVTDPSDLDIDHVVPLANAWRTGASRWTAEQREAFANDLTRPQLIAVTASTNRAKGDQDPSAWQPPRRDYWCQYAHDWVAVKSYWRLSATTAEKAALYDMLETC